jgi:hypothetical protein
MVKEFLRLASKMQGKPHLDLLQYVEQPEFS